MSWESFLPSKCVGESAPLQPHGGFKKVYSWNPSAVESVRRVSSEWGRRKLSQSAEHSTVLQTAK